MFQEKKLFSNDHSCGFLCKHSASFTCFSPICLLKPYEFGSSVDKPGRQVEMYRGGRRDKSRPLCGEVKETVWKGIVQKEEALVYRELDQGQCPFARGEGMFCVMGTYSWECLCRHPAKAEDVHGNQGAHRRGSARNWGLALRTGHAEGRRRIWGIPAGSLLESAEMASIVPQASSGAGQQRACQPAPGNHLLN